MNVDRSSAYSPIAIAGTGTFDLAVVMMPKGMLAREKCDFAGIESQDAMLLILREFYAEMKVGCIVEIVGGSNVFYPLLFV